MIKKILFSLAAFCIFFGFLEVVSRVITFPGSCDYIERCIMDQKLCHKKFPGEYRIFLFGESTMHGHYFYPHSTIGIWIKLYLKDLLPPEIVDRVTVTNFARMGEDTTFSSNAFSDTISYKPDLAVFYMAHNDYIQVEHRKVYAHVVPLIETIENFFGGLPKKSAFLTIINRFYISARSKARERKDSHNKRTDSWYTEGARPSYLSSNILLLSPGSHEFNLICEKFKTNLRRIIKEALSHSVKVIFLEGVSKWPGYGPVCSMHSKILSKEDMRIWDSLNSEAETLFDSKRFEEAKNLYDKCIAIDNMYALTYYRIGECYENLGDIKKANEYYLISNDKDYFPIRAPSVVNKFYEEIRREGPKGVYVIPTRDIFEKYSSNGIIGDDLIGDQIHPTIKAQAIIAFEIVREIYEKRLLTSEDKWRWDKLRSVEDMMVSLNLDDEFKFTSYMGMAGYLEKKYDKVAQVLEKAYNLKPDSLFVNSWLAWAYWKLGRKAESIELYKKIYKKWPDKAIEFFKLHPEIAENVK